MVKGDKSLLNPNPHTHCNKLTSLDYFCELKTSFCEKFYLTKYVENCSTFSKSIFHNWKFYLALLVFLAFLEAISLFGEIWKRKIASRYVLDLETYPSRYRSPDYSNTVWIQFRFVANFWVTYVLKTLSWWTRQLYKQNTNLYRVKQETFLCNSNNS